MTNKKLLEKINRLEHLKHLIETEVKSIYEEHGNLTIEIAEEIINRKGQEVGMMRMPISIKFKNKGKFQVTPNYMKDGQFKNILWKPTGVHAFSVQRINDNL